jgi:hypothetical protein
MARRKESTEQARLRRLWRRWTAVVELFARLRRARQGVHPQAYRALHEKLTATCQALAEQAEGEQRAFYRELEDLAQPWMTPRALEQAEWEILIDLLGRCQEVEQKLEGRVWLPRLRRWTKPLLAVLAVPMGVLLLVWTADWLWLPAWDWVSDWSQRILLAVKRSSDLERMSLVGVIAILIAIYVVSRTARS